MKVPGFQSSSVWFVCLALFAGGTWLRAEPPATAPDRSAAKVSPGAARTKPQIIYRVRPTSDYAARLHSQEKTQNNDLPIDDSMPPSLQFSRANANAAAAEAAAAEARARQEAAPKQERVRQRPQGQRPQMQKKAMSRPPGSMKGKGRGHKGGKH